MSASFTSAAATRHADAAAQSLAELSVSAEPPPVLKTVSGSVQSNTHGQSPKLEAAAHEAAAIVRALTISELTLAHVRGSVRAALQRHDVEEGRDYDRGWLRRLVRSLSASRLEASFPEMDASVIEGLLEQLGCVEDAFAALMQMRCAEGVTPAAEAVASRRHEDQPSS